MDKNLERFLKYFSRKCKINGIKVNFLDTNKIITGNKISCAGYFDPFAKEISISTKAYDDLSKIAWIPLLFHEFSHLLQYENNKDKLIKAVNAQTKFESWVNGKIELPNNEIDKLLDIIITNEIDCEKRTIKLFKKYNFDINIKKYIKEANYQIIMYHIRKLQRKWYDPVIMSEKTLGMMNTSFRGNYKEINQKVINNMMKDQNG